MNTGWLSEVWVTCSLSQDWMHWPCAGKLQAFEQEAHTGKDRCIVAPRLQPCLQVSLVGKALCRQADVFLNTFASSRTCGSCLSSDFLRLLCVCTQLQLVVKVNGPTQSREANGWNHRELEQGGERLNNGHFGLPLNKKSRSEWELVSHDFIPTFTTWVRILGICMTTSEIGSLFFLTSATENICICLSVNRPSQWFETQSD